MISLWGLIDKSKKTKAHGTIPCALLFYIGIQKIVFVIKL